MSQTIRVFGPIGEVLKKYAFSFRPRFDGQLDRFDRNGKILSAWCVGKTINDVGHKLQLLMFGDFATGEKYEWWSRKAISQQEAKELEVQAREERKKYQAAKKQRQEEAAIEITTFWNSLNDAGDRGISPYNLRKGLYELYGARCDGKDLYVPIHSTNGKMQNLQRIEADGTKRPWTGAAISGNIFFVNGYPEKAPTTVYLCEGYSTGCSIFESLRSGPGASHHSQQDPRAPGGLLTQLQRGPNLSDTRQVEKNPTYDITKDGAVFKASRENRRGDSENLQKARAPGQGSSNGDDRRRQLSDQLLAALSVRAPKTIQDARTGRRRDESLRESPSPSGQAFKGNQGFAGDISSAYAGLSRSGESGAGEDSGDAGPRPPRARGSNRPPDGNNLRPQSSRSGQADSHHQGGEEEVPSGDGAAPFTVCAAINAGNLPNAARASRKRWPGAHIIICADDDRWTDDANGRIFNPGREAAIEAAELVSGKISLPLFNPDELALRPTDFNDLQLLTDGQSRVVASLAHTLTPEQLKKRGHEGLLEPAKSQPEQPQELTKPLSLVEFGKGGKTTLPSPQQVANHMLEKYEGLICKQRWDIFKFNTTHWHHLDQHGKDDLYLTIQELCSGLATPEQLKTYTEMLRISAPPVPEGRNIFASDPWSANFLNGTLHVVSGELIFRPHDRHDYIINVLPYHYSPHEELPVNTEFEDMIERIFKGDDDWQEKRRAVAQMFGACLAPMSPHLFMLFGHPGTGKSTIIKLAMRLLHRDNICSVDPSEFGKDFALETMAGKLVNLVTDIDVTSPIRDAIIKRIEDRVEVTINRKHEKALSAPLPAIHIFGGNAIPPTLEGASRAHDRRWTFLKFNQVMAVGRFDKRFAERIFDSCPLGVLRFALEGLKDLVESEGHFVQPRSGALAMESWQLENDPVGEFISRIRDEEVLDGNTLVLLSNEGAIPRTKMYTLFKAFAESSNPGKRPMKESRFYQRVEDLGFRLKKVRGSRFIEGFSVGPGSISVC